MKDFHPGIIAARWARNHPAITRLTLGAIAKPFIALGRKQPPIFDHLAGAVGYMVRVNATLGNGMKMSVVWNDTGGQAIWREGWYEPPTVKVISDLLRPGMTFFDVGANVGQFTLLAAGVNCDVHSFEPAPAIFQVLSDNVRDMPRSAQINQCALSDSEEPVRLYMASPDNLGATSMSKQYCHSGQSFQVACTTVDSYMKKNGVAKVDVMKIDVEGAESFVLRGAEKLLSGPHPPAIVLEYEESAQSRFGSSCAELTRLLTGYGYKLERITDQGLIPYATKEKEDYTFNILARPAVAASRAA